MSAAPKLDAATEETPAADASLERIRRLVRVADGILSSMRQIADERQRETSGRRYKLTEVSEMLDKSVDAIRRAEAAGLLPQPEFRPSGQRLGYTLAEVNRMRDHFGRRPWRAADDEPVLLAVQNFKGGVGKSTIAVHAAQHLAERGYRVLIVDADSQASTTTLFGFNPDRDIEVEDTLLPYLIGDRADGLGYAARATHWDGLDLIPANLGLYSAEYIISQQVKGNVALLSRMKTGLREVARNYDVVVIDPPPALGMISLSVLQAANAILIPTPPSSIDFASTAAYLSMLEEVVETLVETLRLPVAYSFVSLLATKITPAKGAHEAMREVMGHCFGRDILPTALLDSAEFDTASVEMRTVYEHDGATTKTHKRCRNNLAAVMGDLETQIRRTWPSYRAALRAEGIA
ncbi:AAA family ATPase [Parvularcula dongshanensis]|uniref:Chromosome partitioning protein n=1 Tax=Parvularcula dongshanensis TaxID=1173995 RepID=A0A840I4C2_9PROT|nr:AAA family ATPase [Parvularcula dongshanensis]MBB4659054.1 chromosome partitioning protein [Parvularcula dongshanensis]